MVARPASLDVVIPVYNEEESLCAFHASLCAVVDRLPNPVHLYYVSDGSTDCTNEMLEQMTQADPRVIFIELSRNFGHQAALTAGLDRCQSDVVITMDGDGQHPAEMIPQMLELFQAGYDVVLTQRMDQQAGPSFKHWTSATFYRFLNRIGDTRIVPGSADFRLLSRPVVDALKSMREYHRFLRGMVSWMGYRTVIIPYEPSARLAGKSKYSLRKMLKLATDAMFSFSLVPLRIGLVIGGLFLGLAGLEAIYVLSLWLLGYRNTLAPGWSSLMFMLLIVGGTLMIILSFIGIYIGYIFQEVKGRPIYLVRKQQGLPEDPQQDQPEA